MQEGLERCRKPFVHTDKGCNNIGLVDIVALKQCLKCFDRFLLIAFDFRDGRDCAVSNKSIRIIKAGHDAIVKFSKSKFSGGLKGGSAHAPSLVLHGCADDIRCQFGLEGGKACEGNRGNIFILM